MTDKAIRTIIVDDEPLAREGIRLLLSADREIDLVGECGSGPDAVDSIRRLKPDLAFLDIQMPGMNGFDVLTELAPGKLPAVVFVTAYDQYALRAFEVHALDYLLKPYDDDRFFEALKKAKQQLRMAEVSALSERLLDLLDNYEPPKKRVSRLAIKSSGRVVFLNVDDIDWIEAADYYVQLHVGDKTYLHRQSMTSLEKQLDPEAFLRIHRSAIVHRDRIRELRHQGRRELVVVLDSGVELKVARSQRDKIQGLL
ncbi:MAG: LytTR family DNA-binding domain-containing protein [Proteobacteria bacterium]|nr:LytTR family DNA-binding domain-containing protein [Pseudomonadota bacterium]